MSTYRLNIEFPAGYYTHLKKLCAKRGIPIKDFVISLILKSLEKEEDAILSKKAKKRLKNMDPQDLIPIEEAFEEAGWKSYF